MKNFQKKFFARLADLENELTLNAKEEYCNIFILGLPRSGTTLLSQIIYAGTNCLCVNNLMARFTDAPLVGAMVSKLSITKSFAFVYDLAVNIQQVFYTSGSNETLQNDVFC